MKKSLLLTTLALYAAGSAIGFAQTAERMITPPRPVQPKFRPFAPKYLNPLKPVLRELRLRDGAVTTGLTGFYDYQSNGGSPGYITVLPGTPEYLLTTYMTASDGSSVDAANASRRVGYAYSGDGGLTWVSTTSIYELRLGFPYLQVSAAGIPYIATHGDLGAGDRAFIFATSELNAVENFFPFAELPLRTQSGRDGGVAWPSFVLNGDASTATVLGSYSNDEGQPLSPLQVASVSMGDGSTHATWANLTDSLVSTTAGGRAIIARSPAGKIGAAWFKYELDSNDNSWGVYYAESNDGGQTWSAATPVLIGEQMLDEVNINGNVDTLTAGSNLDLAFRGEEPQLVFTGSLNNLLQFANVMYWSPSTGLRMIAMSHQVPGLGAYLMPLEKRQQNMGSIAYPTVSVGDDGRHVVVAFSAASQTIDEQGNFVDDAISAEGFQYFRVWGVGSSDGGLSWGVPFIIQDFAEKGSDSASIEYPCAAEIAHVNNGTFDLPLVFQARRYPGMYTYTGTGDAATEQGPINECSQFYQRFVVTPSMFRSTSSAEREVVSELSAEIYPNRTSSIASLRVVLARATELDVTLVDALGRLIAHPVNAKMYGAGRHNVQIDAGGLPSGSYHCIVRHDAGVVARRLEVIR